MTSHQLPCPLCCQYVAVMSTPQAYPSFMHLESRNAGSNWGVRFNYLLLCVAIVVLMPCYSWRLLLGVALMVVYCR